MAPLMKHPSLHQNSTRDSIVVVEKNNNGGNALAGSGSLNHDIYEEVEGEKGGDGSNGHIDETEESQ